MVFGQFGKFGTSDLLGIAHKLNLAMRTKREAISRLKHFLTWLNLQQTHTRMQNVLSTVKITIRTRLRQSNFIIQVVFGNLTSCPVEGARTFL